MLLLHRQINNRVCYISSFLYSLYFFIFFSCFRSRAADLLKTQHNTNVCHVLIKAAVSSCWQRFLLFSFFTKNGRWYFPTSVSACQKSPHGLFCTLQNAKFFVKFHFTKNLALLVKKPDKSDIFDGYLSNSRRAAAPSSSPIRSFTLCIHF